MNRVYVHELISFEVSIDIEFKCDLHNRAKFSRQFEFIDTIYNLIFITKNFNQFKSSISVELVNITFGMYNLLGTIRYQAHAGDLSLSLSNYNYKVTFDFSAI